MKNKDKTAIPSSIYHSCDICGSVLHKILKGRYIGRGFNAVLKCSGCGKVSEKHIERSGEKRIPVIVSWLAESRKDFITLNESETVALDDELVVGGSKVIITGIESEGKRVLKCRVQDITTLWVKKFDMVLIKASIYSKKGRVRSVAFLISPDQILHIGDSIEIDGHPYNIYSIKTKGGPIRRGESRARDTIRIYVDIPHLGDRRGNLRRRYTHGGHTPHRASTHR